MGRHIDPSRCALPFSDWPKVDREAWSRAIAPGDILDGRGPAAHWVERTKATNRQHYAHWLGFLAWRNTLSPTTLPADRATAEAIRAYVHHLQGIVAPITVLSMLVGLKVALQAMAPDRSWRWLQDVCNRIQRTAKPSTDKRRRMRDSGAIFQAAIRELAPLMTAPPSLETAIRFRDALMLALLTRRPLRVKNMQGIHLHQQLVRTGDDWLLVFAATETKNKQHLEYGWPEDLVAELEVYLSRFRPMFPEAGTSARLWLSKDGAALGGNFVYYRLTRLTRALFGNEVNPHLLRDCAATRLAMESSDAARSARALLGHRHFSTTERYYIQANQLEASRRFNAILDTVKKSLKDVA